MYIPWIYNVYTEFILWYISVSPTGRSKWSGGVSLDLELLKQYKVSAVTTDAIERSGEEYFFPQRFHFFPTKGAFSPHAISKFSVRHETRSGV